jgi:creatinine amidohydrolase
MERGSNQPSLKCRLKNWWEAPAVKSLSRELYGNSEGSHATPSEVSLTWHAYPQAARPMTMDPPIAPNGDFSDAEDYRRNFPDGRIGSNPGLATADAGGKFLAAAADFLAKDYNDWLAR